MTTHFALALHCHQPVGNFPWVLEEAYEKAYRPFLEHLVRHPKVRLNLHFSGALLDWLAQEHGDFLRQLQRLVREGQVEVLGGGLYEPILPLLPAPDALGQLTGMKKRLAELHLDGPSGQGNPGAWLAERVWQPQVASYLYEAGYRYTIVDDHHLKLAGVPEEKRFGYYWTESAGQPVALFPSLKLLRYQVPFRPVSEVLETLRGFASEEPRVAVLADDGEKFGLWPGTHAWVYREGWLEGFLTELTRASGQWLKMVTFSEALKNLPPLGRIYLPCAAYEELMTWSAGDFNNFLVKYPEADAMHKRMLWVSRRLGQARSKAKKAQGPLRSAARHLYMAQGNDPYWHGIFGGLYLRHLRRAVWRHLLAAEREMDSSRKGRAWAEAEAADLDSDGQEEVLLRSNQQTLLVNPARGGQLTEWSDKESLLNLLDTLSRRPEAYHEKLKGGGALQPAAVSSASPAAPLSIHESSPAAALGLAPELVYDSYRRCGLIDHCFAPEEEAGSFASSQARELGDFIGGPYTFQVKRLGLGVKLAMARTGKLSLKGEDHPLRLAKGLTLPARGRGFAVTYRLTNASRAPLSFLFGSETNLGVKDAHVNRVGQADGIRRFSVLDPGARLEVSWSLSRPARLWHFPIETISDSERGLERTYQGASLTFLWRVDLKAGQSWQVSYRLQAELCDVR